ncbi:hypothetical protein FLONG3_9292 [Fusarium longipes]|uniref:Uncharacterized protein n=1 Tax=Fusarium longipes TaxID=694270 RepID=A0A395RYT0_9HYPO|nr:hypothetical protein FLONG3_9292 [Fusarium longipes]
MPSSPTRRGTQLTLPELHYHIIEAVLPSNPRTIIPPWHISTKTLVSLTRVSRSTRKVAMRLLLERCPYVDTSRRLELLLCVPRLYLTNITSLYLTPFGNKLNDLPKARLVRKLFFAVRRTLRRLVIDMPSELVDDHMNVRRILGQGFERLTKLHEFVCLGDYPVLSIQEAPTKVWDVWPDLRRLVIFGAPINNHRLWWHIATRHNLEQVILARPLAVEATNIKEEFFNKLPRDDKRLDRDIKITLLDAAFVCRKVNTWRWKEYDPEGRITVEVYDVPTSFYGDETPEELVAAWVRRGALNGNLWDWEGEVVEDTMTNNG